MREFTWGGFRFPAVFMLFLSVLCFSKKDQRTPFALYTVSGFQDNQGNEIPISLKGSFFALSGMAGAENPRI